MLSKFKGFPNFFIRLSQNPVFAYHENVIDHYEKPRNVGSMDKKAKNIGTGLVGAPACGDVMKLQIKVGEDGQTIEDAVFKVFFFFFKQLFSFYLTKTFGCGSAIASSSYATELIKGMNINEASNITNKGKNLFIFSEI